QQHAHLLKHQETRLSNGPLGIACAWRKVHDQVVQRAPISLLPLPLATAIVFFTRLGHFGRLRGAENSHPVGPSPFQNLSYLNSPINLARCSMVRPSGRLTSGPDCSPGSWVSSAAGGLGLR